MIARAARRATASLALVALAFALDATATRRAADAAPAGASSSSLHGSVDRATVGLGDTIDYTISGPLSGGRGQLSLDPGSIEGFEILNTSQSSRSQVSISDDGRRTRSTVFSMTYTLRATKLGKHLLGPATLSSSGSKTTGTTVNVEVLPADKVPKRRHDDDDPFGFPIPIPQEPPRETARHDVPLDPLMRIDAVPPDGAERHIFLRLVVDDAQPVVGAQVTAKLFVYAHGNASVDMPKRPPGFIDFHTFTLPLTDRDWHEISIGGDTWRVGCVGVYLVFPLRVGASTITPAQLDAGNVDWMGRRTGDIIPLESNALTLDVKEPPLAGRPAGYALSSVASGLSIQAVTSPSTVKDGHAVVTITMTGRGRLDPIPVELSKIAGVTFERTADEEHEAPERDHLIGHRRVVFDAAFDHPGDVDLGSWSVPIWNPDTRAYATLHTELGKIHVEQPVAPATSSSAPVTAPSLVGSARSEVGIRGDGSSIADRAATWLAAAGAPIAVLGIQLGLSALGRSRRRRAEARSDPAAKLSETIAAARRARDEGKRGDEAALATRVIELAIELRTGERAKGRTRSEVEQMLNAASVAGDLVEATLTLLAALDDVRFSSSGTAGIDDADAVVARLLASSSGGAAS